jgi:ACS family tartrate transporter-like MFS transporter
MPSGRTRTRLSASRYCERVVQTGCLTPTMMPRANELEVARATLARIRTRLLPVLVTLFLFNWIDRTNLSIAALQMNRDLHFSAAVYGLGAGVFFVGYAIFEVPSNLTLARVGARRWIARIAISWGLVASGMVFVRTPSEFYAMRFLLGAAEAGFLPGVIYYLTNEQRAGSWTDCVAIEPNRRRRTM